MKPIDKIVRGPDDDQISCRFWDEFESCSKSDPFRSGLKSLDWIENDRSE